MEKRKKSAPQLDETKAPLEADSRSKLITFETWFSRKCKANPRTMKLEHYAALKLYMKKQGLQDLEEEKLYDKEFSRY